MAEQDYAYIIVGGGLAGASAVEGIREVDGKGSVLLICNETHLPYHRPPLSKQLWLGKKKVGEIFVHDRQFYEKNNVTLALDTEAAKIRPNEKTVLTAEGRTYHFGRLLMATGGRPRRLPVRGGDLDGICYYRRLDDYLRMKEGAGEGSSAVVIGGGFIGSEMAAALAANRVSVTMIFPGPYFCDRVFPEYLGIAIQNIFISRGVTVLSGDRPRSFEKRGGVFVTATEKGRHIESDMVIVGIGIEPSLGLAEEAGLKTANGIVVDEYLRTSHPDVYAAGDNALFPYRALGRQMRVEHWDNALNQGRQAGRNMAGAGEPFNYMPYFFSDLFEFGYEAVGEVDSGLETFADWKKENDTGVIYYLKDRKVRGVMMCNVWEKVEAARALIRKGEQVAPEDLRGVIR